MTSLQDAIRNVRLRHVHGAPGYRMPFVAASDESSLFPGPAQSIRMRGRKVYEEQAVWKDNIVELLGDVEFADVLFIVGDEEEWIYAHRNILSEACDYFKQMFLGGFTESREEVIKIPTADPGAFRLLLEYCYFGDIFEEGVDLTHEETFELLLLADQYFVTDLKRDCEAALRAAITLDNVIPLLELSRTYGWPLEATCLQFMARNVRALLPTSEFRSLDKETLLQVMDVSLLGVSAESVCRNSDSMIPALPPPPPPEPLPLNGEVPLAPRPPRVQQFQGNTGADDLFKELVRHLD